MNKSNRFSPEIRERAAVASLAAKIGWVPHALLEWVITRLRSAARLDSGR